MQLDQMSKKELRGFCICLQEYGCQKKMAVGKSGFGKMSWRKPKSANNVRGVRILIVIILKAKWSQRDFRPGKHYTLSLFRHKYCNGHGIKHQLNCTPQQNFEMADLFWLESVNTPRYILNQS